MNKHCVEALRHKQPARERSTDFMLPWLHPLALMASKGEVKKGEVGRFPPLEIKTKGRISGLPDNILSQKLWVRGCCYRKFQTISLTLLTKKILCIECFVYIYAHVCLLMAEAISGHLSLWIGATDSYEQLWVSGIKPRCCLRATSALSHQAK